VVQSYLVFVIRISLTFVTENLVRGIPAQMLCLGQRFEYARNGRVERFAASQAVVCGLAVASQPAPLKVGISGLAHGGFGQNAFGELLAISWPRVRRRAIRALKVG